MANKITIILLFFFTGVGFSPLLSSSSAQQRTPLRTIIIDPGHGGHDVGARGAYSLEKDVCLSIALKLGQLLEDAFPDVKVLYTRKTDTYPELRARADFANANRGDLFLSIHANAAPRIRNVKRVGYRTAKNGKKVPRYSVTYSPNPSHGTETYIWAADRSDEKEKFIGEDFVSEQVHDSTEYVPDINDPEFKAKALLWTKKFFDRSLLLASLVEEGFVAQGRFSRGVKQRNEKGIWVLQATSMPSILVEVGFLSNKHDEDYINSADGQQAVAENILNAVRKYRELTEGSISVPSVAAEGN